MTNFIVLTLKHSGNNSPVWVRTDQVQALMAFDGYTTIVLPHHEINGGNDTLDVQETPDVIARLIERAEARAVLGLSGPVTKT